MEKLLKDGNTMVLGSAVAAFTEVRFYHLHRRLSLFIIDNYLRRHGHTKSAVSPIYASVTYHAAPKSRHVLIVQANRAADPLLFPVSRL